MHFWNKSEKKFYTQEDGYIYLVVQQFTPSDLQNSNIDYVELCAHASGEKKYNINIQLSDLFFENYRKQGEFIDGLRKYVLDIGNTYAFYQDSDGLINISFVQPQPQSLINVFRMLAMIEKIDEDTLNEIFQELQNLSSYMTMYLAAKNLESHKSSLNNLDEIEANSKEKGKGKQNEEKKEKQNRKRKLNEQVIPRTGNNIQFDYDLIVAQRLSRESYERENKHHKGSSSQGSAASNTSSASFAQQMEEKNMKLWKLIETNEYTRINKTDEYDSIQQTFETNDQSKIKNIVFDSHLDPNSITLFIYFNEAYTQSLMKEQFLADSKIFFNNDNKVEILFIADTTLKVIFNCAYFNQAIDMINSIETIDEESKKEYFLDLQTLLSLYHLPQTSSDVQNAGKGKEKEASTLDNMNDINEQILYETMAAYFEEMDKQSHSNQGSNQGSLSYVGDNEEAEIARAIALSLEEAANYSQNAVASTKESVTPISLFKPATSSAGSSSHSEEQALSSAPKNM